MKIRAMLVLLLALPLARGQAPDQTFRSGGAPATLLELYSSEGCSSCPPAEAWISGWRDAPGLWKTLFPVVFHVDYWDGLGWPDRFARAEFTQRQRDYAARLGQDSVYTPEFVADGREWRPGAANGRLPSPASGAGGVLTLTFQPGGRRLFAHYEAPASAPREPLQLNAALLGLGIVSRVERGENAGTTLRHDFVVLVFASAPLSSLGGASVTLPGGGPDQPGALVSWVSAGDGSIRQVAGGTLR